jgi:hypothetical protein
MASPVPFRTKKGEEFSPWKALVNGKAVELAPNNATKEEADAALAKLLPSTISTEKQRSVSIGDLLKKSEQTAQAGPSPSIDSKLTASPTDKETSSRPKTGEVRTGGLSELSPAKVKAFREAVAGAIATGNVSLDRALVSIFRDKVPILAPEQYLLLSTGWELACEQYFVNGLPPAWIIILLGNAMVCTALVEKSEPKPPEELPTHDGSIGNPPKRA